ncbi:MAG: hypothetical protein ACI9UN_003306 [Granulosicoccus sp.]|jgi:hypothetical protein
MEANPDFTSLSTSQLESRITQLCADLNAATYRQLMMIAEFDLRQGWGDEGVRSCAHWLNYKCGISLVAAREKIRVAHALAKLPKHKKHSARVFLVIPKHVPLHALVLTTTKTVYYPLHVMAQPVNWIRPFACIGSNTIMLVSSWLITTKR